MKYHTLSRLRRERERRGWSRLYIAAQLEVDIITVGRWERGERLPHPLYRQKLCNLFGISAQDLGLFSEYPPHDKDLTDTAHLTSEEPDSVREHTGSAPLLHASRALADGVESSQNRFFTENQTMPAPSPWSRHRRAFLAGLGGLGIAALAGAGFHLLTHSSSPPPVLASRLVRQLFDPSNPHYINRLAWSPDGHLIATATGINRVTIWNWEKGALARSYPTSHQWVNDVSWSKTNWLAAAASGPQAGSVEIWKYLGDGPVVTLQRPHGIRSASWSPDGTMLAFSGHTSVVEIWNPFAHRRVGQYSYPALGLLGMNRVRWSTTGTLLACATDDGTVHVWEALTGHLKTIYHGHQLRTIDLDWSPDGRYIASAGEDKTVRVWEALTGHTIQIYQGHTDAVEGVNWSLQGGAIASGGLDQTAHIWEAFTGKLVAECSAVGSPLETVLWSRDGTAIAVGTNTQGTQIWQIPRSSSSGK